MSSPLWLVRLIKTTFPSRVLLAKATRLPLVGTLLDRWLFAGDNLFYVPPDHLPRRVAVGQPVEDPGSVVAPSQVVEHFVQQAQHHFIMNTCICRDAGHCQDYPVDLGCLFLGDAVLGINPKLGQLVSKDEALAHVRRCREAGLVHLIGRNKLDTVWLGVGPGDRLLTVCNCCSCCCLWRVLPHVAPQIGDKVTRMDGVSVVVTDRCQGCGSCAEDICFVNAIQMVDGRAVISAECRGCGRCVDICPHDAIELTVANDAFVENAIARLAPLVDVS